jgi:hypothetical protein
LERSSDERSDIRGFFRPVPHVAEVVRATCREPIMWTNVVDKTRSRSLVGQFWQRLFAVLLSFLFPITNALANSYPAPQCLPITSSVIYPHLELIARGDYRSDLDLPTRRNAEYFFRKILPERGGPKLEQVHFLTFGSASLFFPEKECPTGCTAYLVRTNENGRGNLVKPLFFVSHMVSALFPVPAWMFLAPDRERLIEINLVKRKSGGYVTEVHERKSPRVRWLPDAVHEMSPRQAKTCLLTGEFFETSPPENPDPK